MAIVLLLIGMFILIGLGRIASAMNRRQLKRGFFMVIAGLVVFFIVLLLGTALAEARDPDGRYAQQNPELHKWFEGLRSGKGPCCSDADGMSVADVDWDTLNGHYRVRLDVSTSVDKVDMQWIDVPDEAVITEPNKIGRTMVWPIRGYLGMTIRCFMPGPGT